MEPGKALAAYSGAPQACPQCDGDLPGWHRVLVPRPAPFQDEPPTEELRIGDCERGQYLRALRSGRIRQTPKSRPPHPPILSDKAALSAAKAMLGDMKWDRTNDEMLGLVSKSLQKMVGRPGMSPGEAKEHLTRFVEYFCRLYTEWPGTRELRIVYSQDNWPLDGISLRDEPSEIYPAGIPPEIPLPPVTPALPQSSAPRIPLPPGHSQTVDVAYENAIHAGAEIRKLPPARVTAEDRAFAANLGFDTPAAAPESGRLGERLLRARAERNTRDECDRAARRELHFSDEA